jgi:hypothetical protein
MHFRYFFLVLFCSLASATLYASPSGYVGRTLPTSQGCGGGGCHGSTASTATTVSLSTTQPIVMQPGETIQLSVVVAHETRTRAGINIAVKSSLTAQTNAGTLIAGAGLFLSGGELTHASPKSMSSGEATFSFSWKAPTTPGTYYLLATGNAVNANGRQDVNDLWNHMTPIQITVENTTDVAVVTIPVINSLATPLPSSNLVTVEFSAEPQERFDMAVTDMQGQRIFEGAVTAESERGIFQWDGGTAEGIPARTGAYMITLISDRRIVRSRALIIH